VPKTNSQMVLKGRLNIVPCPSVAVVRYPIHQHFTKWECAIPKGDVLWAPKFRVQQFCKVLRGTEMFMICRIIVCTSGRRTSTVRGN